MKVTIINASQRGNAGNTQLLLNPFCKGLKRADVHYSIIHLNEKKLIPCCACDKCRSVGHCVLKDNIPEIFDCLSKSDYVVFAFPIYSFHFPAKLKILFERMYSVGDNSDLIVSKNGLVFHQLNKSICGKPYAVIVNYGNIEYAAIKSSIDYFKSFSDFTDATNIGTLQRNTMKIISRHQDKATNTKFPNIEEILNAYEKAGYELGTQGKISKKTQKIANQEIIPIPFFSILKHCKIKSLKSRLVEIGKKSTA